MKHVHFVGICGVGMAAAAVMMQKMGWKVTGSDKGFFPPISGFLKENKIDFYPGWHPEKIGNPDEIIVGNFISLNNPEYVFAQKNDFLIKSYPELIGKYVVKKNSVVVAGTFGKTTIAAFTAHLFRQAGLNPSWFIGGLANDFSCGAADNKGDWSVAEGDEYTTARWDPRSKFLLYKPTHLILTSVLWDHLDVFPKERDYNQTFEKLIGMIPSQGLIIAAKRKNTQKIDGMISRSKAKTIRYGKREFIDSPDDYAYEIVSLNEHGSEFTVYRQNKILGKFKTNLLGEHLVENLLAGIALSYDQGIDPEITQRATENFQGVKRRLEIRKETKGIRIIDDLAHSPSKARASLTALKAHFPKARIFAIFEPNVGNRMIGSQDLYLDAFLTANTVIIPRLSQTKTNEEQERRMDGKELKKIIGQKNKGVNVLYLENDEELTKFLADNAVKGDIVVFLGSHGFRGMIEKTTEKLQVQQSEKRSFIFPHQ